MAVVNDSKVSSWVLFIGIMLLLIGIYAAGRTAINLAFFQKYPQGGVLSININGVPPYYQKESDCLYPSTYVDDTKTQEQRMTDEKKQQEICLSNVSDERERAKINDISQSMLFLFLGAGILISKKIFFK